MKKFEAEVAKNNSDPREEKRAGAL
jgi:hypothetical protein